MSRKYIIGAGYHGHPGDGRSEFFKVWIENTLKFSQPDRFIVIADDNSDLPEDSRMTAIRLSGDLGHCGDLIHGKKKFRFPGGVAVLLSLAGLAYTNECDLIYKEQDMLWFGDCAGRMYSEIKDGGIIFGYAHAIVPCENCMILIKHEFIPEFLSLYGASGPEHDPKSICEWKFQRWAMSRPMQWRKHTIYGGRDRPMRFDLSESYYQKITPSEMEELRKRQMI